MLGSRQRGLVLTLGFLLLAGAVAAAGRGTGPVERTVRGVLTVLQEDDFASGASRRIYYLHGSTDDRVYELRFAEPPRQRLLSGTRVLVEGRLWGQQLTVAPQGLVVEQAAAAIGGARTAVVLIVNFSDSVVWCPDSLIEGLMFTGNQSVNGLYEEGSFGAVSFPGDTDGNGQPDVFRVSISATTSQSCNAYGWADLANAAAQSQGINLGLYQHRLYVLPSNASCSWAGLAGLGCYGACEAWVKTCDLPDVYAHELGHNLGMFHSSTDEDNDGVIDCEYCDRSDVMGIGGIGWRQVNGPHKEQMAWLPDEQVVQIEDDGEQVYVISPLTTDPSQAAYPQLLKIQRAGSSDVYHLSYRTRTGYDSNLSVSYADQTNIHGYPQFGAANTRFIDALADGEEFSDGSGLTITQLSHDATSATILVGSGCQASSPGIVVASASQAGRPGDELEYAITLTNDDSSSCGSTSFDLSAGLPSGWTHGYSPSSLTLGPGGQASATISVVSSVGASDGVYALALGVEVDGSAVHQVSAAASYRVDATPPTPVTNLSGSVMRVGSLRLSWAPASDSGSGVAIYRVFKNGSLLATTEGTSFVDAGIAPGQSHEYTVVAVDAVGNASDPGDVLEITIRYGSRAQRSQN